MQANVRGRRWYWLAVGMVAGMALAAIWPHEPALATNSDRDQEFALLTVPVGSSAAGITDPLDGVFVLDFLTGQLKGAVLNRAAAAFTSFYYIDLTKEFGIEPGQSARYAIASGYGQINNRSGVTFASGTIYIGEYTTGKILAYSFPWKEGVTRPGPPLPLARIAAFPFRQASDRTQ